MRLAQAACLTLALALPQGASAQDQSLADIRAELSTLYVELQSLRSELNTTGLPGVAPAGNTALQRLDALEAQVQRLTGKTEDLEFRINRIVTDGTNRVGDLEFRLCEVTPDCDIGALGDTPSLGGVDIQAQIPTPAPPPAADSPTLAVGEQADFERAQEALASGDFLGAAEQFAAFVQTYPGGPLNARAMYLRGTALEESGDLTTAARAYLEAFSGAPDGETAPDALYKLGATLAALGQTVDACLTLGEVGTRFPGSGAESQAQAMMASLACS